MNVIIRTQGRPDRVFLVFSEWVVTTTVGYRSADKKKGRQNALFSAILIWNMLSFGYICFRGKSGGCRFSWAAGFAIPYRRLNFEKPYH